MKYIMSQISECFCNNDGSRSFICDVQSGNCTCKSDLISGVLCDRSKHGYYNFPNPKRMLYRIISLDLFNINLILQPVNVTLRALKEMDVMMAVENVHAKTMLLEINVFNVLRDTLDSQIVRVNKNIYVYTYLCCYSE